MPKLALINIQKQADQSWRWTAYDEHGQTLGTQDKCGDEVECMENVLRWIHPAASASDAAAKAAPQSQAATRPRKPRKTRSRA
jgi:hypothetical protein